MLNSKMKYGYQPLNINLWKIQVILKIKKKSSLIKRNFGLNNFIKLINS